MKPKHLVDDEYDHVFDEFQDGYGSEALVGACRPWNLVEPAPRVPDWAAAPSLWAASISRGNLATAAVLDRNLAKPFRHGIGGVGVGGIDSWRRGGLGAEGYRPVPRG